MTRHLAVLGLLLGTTGCIDNTAPRRTLDNSIGVIASGLVAPRSAAMSSRSVSILPAQVVYVSLSPNAVPTGVTATITNRETNAVIATAVVNGGFDPVSIAAAVDDTLGIEIATSVPDSVVHASLVVTARRPPRVVRTNPPPGGRDVPLNATMVIVFSEPIDSAALSDGSIRLLHDATPVAGTLRFGDDFALRVEFHPASLLASQTTYRLQVGTAIRDLNGAALDAPLDVLFTTATSAPATELMFASVSAGEFYSCGVTTTGEAYCWGAVPPSGEPGPRPAPVAGGLTFASVSAGGEQVCGVTTDGAAYCWGDIGYGQVPLDSATLRACVAFFYCPTPVPVPGGLTFATISSGNMQRCGVTTDGAAYCWGDDPFAPDVTTPRPVPGGLTFATVSAGGSINCGVGSLYCGSVSCGVTTTGDAYCWGHLGGVLGDGSTTRSTVPVKVAGGLTFKTVSAGEQHVCGVTTDGTAYCWGVNADGELGDGTTTNSTVPAAVAGGLSFATISAGFTSNTCGVTTAGAAYCWGAYVSGIGFVGGQPPSTTPVAVPGGFTFATLSTGFGSHRCGMHTGGTAYCWGVNINGELGDGTTTQSAVPVRVGGQP